jgi:predicted nucleic acid-binding protein
MNVLADTNIVLDVLLKREPHFEASYALFSLAVKDKLNILITATSITDIYYLLRRSGKDDLTARNALQQLLSFTLLVDVRPDDIQRALQSPVSDFEDAVAAEVAKRNKCKAIITRNVKDFAGSAIPSITPQEFIQKNKTD